MMGVPIEDHERLRKLADHVIQHNYPSLKQQKNPYVALLQEVVNRQASLIAQWMGLGFIHGVMNTDNMSVAGETIDYGPCAFIDAYKHDRVFSSIDRNGRYAYNNQPSIGLWNLTRLAECLVPLVSENTEEAVELAQEVLESYIQSYQHHWLAGMRAKLGLSGIEKMEEADKSLIESLFNAMDANNADFTLTFFHLSQVSAESPERDNACHSLFDDPEAFDQWAVHWRERLLKESTGDKERQSKMRTVNPVYIPRNHQIEAAIRAAEDHNDFSVFHALHEVLQNPYEQQPGKESYQMPPEPEEIVEQTFCGT